jgi:predicted DNA-binding transcriptional regulator AlpA
MHTKQNPTISPWFDKRSVCEFTLKSEMTIYRYEKLPADDPLQFPKRFYVGGKAYWDSQEVFDWMDRNRKLGSVDTSTRHPAAKGKAA